MQSTLDKLFIGLNENIDSDHPNVSNFANASKEDLIERWSTETGKRILHKVKNKEVYRENYSDLTGCLYGKLDLRGIDLGGENLKNRDLSNIDFFSANFKNCNMVGANLDGSYLSESNIEGADLSWSNLNNTFFDGVKFNKDTKLIGIKNNEINSNLAILLVDQANTQQRIAHFKEKYKITSYFLWLSCDYGQSISRLIFWIFLFTILFAAIYYHFDMLSGANGLIDNLYFSVITMTTLGYGDLLPKNEIAKLIVISQVILGYTLGGLLVAIVARRMITLSL